MGWWLARGPLLRELGVLECRPITCGWAHHHPRHRPHHDHPSSTIIIITPLPSIEPSIYFFLLLGVRGADSAGFCFVVTFPFLYGCYIAGLCDDTRLGSVLIRSVDQDDQHLTHRLPYIFLVSHSSLFLVSFYSIAWFRTKRHKHMGMGFWRDGNWTNWDWVGLLVFVCSLRVGMDKTKQAAWSRVSIFIFIFVVVVHTQIDRQED